MHETLVKGKFSMFCRKTTIGEGEGDHDEKEDGINDACEIMSLTSNCSLHLSMKGLKTDGT